MAESSIFFAQRMTLNKYEQITRNDNRGDFYGYHYYSKRL